MSGECRRVIGGKNWCVQSYLDDEALAVVHVKVLDLMDHAHAKEQERQRDNKRKTRDDVHEPGPQRLARDRLRRNEGSRPWKPRERVSTLAARLTDALQRTYVGPDKDGADEDGAVQQRVGNDAGPQDNAPSVRPPLRSIVDQAPGVAGVPQG